MKPKDVAVAILACCCCSLYQAFAQERPVQKNDVAHPRVAELKQQVAQILDRVERLESQLAQMRIPSDLKSCQELIVSQQERIDDLQIEQEKLRKLLEQMIHGNRSEKRIFSGADQALLPFESEEEFKAAQVEAEAEAETIIEKYTVERHTRKKKPRNESLPSHLERVEQIVEAPEEMKNCPQHGARKIIDYDITETLMRDPPRLWVLQKKYPKYACPADPSCGIASPERRDKAERKQYRAAKRRVAPRRKTSV